LVILHHFTSLCPNWLFDDEIDDELDGIVGVPHFQTKPYAIVALFQD
jgi:hypothetical protein